MIMRRLFTLTVMALLLSVVGADAQNYRKWDFTQWSATTIDNLKAEDVKGGIDGAGWSVFEASREYEESSPLLPEGTSADGEESDGLTSSAEDIIYRSAPPRTAAEIRAEKETTKTSGRLILMPFGILAAALAAGRIRAAYRWSLRRKHDDTAALKADHFQGRQLMEEVLGLHGLPPEVLAEKAEGLLGTRFAESERAYEELRFSDKAPDDKALEKARRFYEEALRASKKQGRIKSLIRRLRGLY